jgi:hypothetical protein
MAELKERRRYLVGEAGGNPGWGFGILRSWGCKHEKSAWKLFNKLAEYSDCEGDIFLFDRETGKLLARRNETTPEQDKEFIKLFGL